MRTFKSRVGVPADCREGSANLKSDDGGGGCFGKKLELQYVIVPREFSDTTSVLNRTYMLAVFNTFVLFIESFTIITCSHYNKNTLLLEHLSDFDEQRTSSCSINR